MKIQFMHIIDKYIGIPVCFLLSIINNLKKKKNSERKKFLFIELPEMGSALLSYDAIQYLKQKYKNSELYFMIFKQNKESINILNIIKTENLISIRSDTFTNFVIDIIKSWYYLKRVGIDVVIDMEIFSRFSSIFSFLIGGKERVGFYIYGAAGLYRGNLLTHKVSYNYYSHISKNYMALIKSLEIPDKSQEPIIKNSINFQPSTLIIEKDIIVEEKLRNLLKNICEDYTSEMKSIIISPFAGDLPIRGWKPDYYIELCKRFLKKSVINTIIITGTKEAIKLHKEIENKINLKRCINITGKTNLTEFIQLCHICDFIITSDGGAAHFAALTDIKGLVFFGPETPQIYKPLSDKIEPIYLNYNCSPCLNAFNYRITKCKDNQCLKNISVDLVFEKLNKIVYIH